MHSLTAHRELQVSGGAPISVADWLFAQQMPFAADEAALMLVDHGVSALPIDPSAIEVLARLLDYQLDFHVDIRDGVVVPAGSRSVTSSGRRRS
jgi:hypothetical protein